MYISSFPHSSKSFKDIIDSSQRRIMWFSGPLSIVTTQREKTLWGMVKVHTMWPQCSRFESSQEPLSHVTFPSLSLCFLSLYTAILKKKRQKCYKKSKKDILQQLGRVSIILFPLTTPSKMHHHHHSQSILPHCYNLSQSLYTLCLCFHLATLFFFTSSLSSIG